MIRDIEIDTQLRRILESSPFVTSARSRQFLEFCVNRTMSGQASQLKETTIAIEVFLRAADYDPKVDPIVRVHARRVREKLDLYYRTAGTHDPIKIDLPKGGYVPQIFRTLPKRKTEFSDWDEPSIIAEQKDTGPSRTASIARTADQSANGSKHLSWILISAVMLGIALLSFAFAWFWRGMQPASPAAIGPLKPLDSIPGYAGDAAWSPDGTQLAFTLSQADGKPHIYTKSIYSGELPVRLTEGNTAESRPVWSPDGSEIAFVQQIDLSQFEIVRLRLADKALRSIGRFVTYWPIPEDHPALDWSSDGRYLLTAEQTDPANPMRIILISLATGERTALTSPPVESSGDIDAKFSPDSQWIAFRRGGLGDLYVVSIKGEQSQPAVRLTFDTKGVRGIAWIDRGKSILFGTQRSLTSPLGLWKIPKTGGAPQPITPQDFDAINPAVSSRGILAIEHRQVVTELVERSLTANSADHIFLPSDALDSSPAYSPDGKSVVFTSTRTGWIELWLYSLGETAPRQLTHFQGSGITFLPSWSPDSRSIAFSFRQDGATNIYTYDLAGNALRKITSTRNRDISPSYSSDGSFIYYSSNDDGTSRIWRMHSDGSGRAEPLFLQAVVGFQPSPDGKWLYYTHDGQEPTLLRRNLQTGITEEIFHVPGRSSFFNKFAIANRHIYLAVSQYNASNSDVFEIEPESRTFRIVTHLKELPPFSESGLSGFSVYPDGSKLIVGHTKRNESTFYSAQLAGYNQRP